MNKPRPVMTADEVARFYAGSPWSGSAFHNPYTFIPFPAEPPTRRPPTPLTVDEVETDRFTGVLELKVTTRTPLMSCDPTPIGEDQETGHRTYRALTIGSDVIVPATGVRGALRTLLTIIVGGTLGYLDDELHLCQGRDATLGPRGKNGSEATPARAFLARVRRRPSREGGIELEFGETRLVQTEALERLGGSRRELDKLRPTSRVRPEQRQFIDNPDRPGRIASGPSDATPWQLKLSGRRVNTKGTQREGAFKPDGRVVRLDNRLYRDYLGRHRNAVQPELQKGDLVWLEPTQPGLERIDDAGQVRSIQWARWGRRGTPLQDLIPQEFWPDYMRDDGLVDEVTDLFGMASPDPDHRVSAFAARVRPENLVFFDAAGKVDRTTLAPLAPPKPGCLTFYRDQDDPALVSRGDLVRGYKVYRVPAEGDEPWRYSEQPVFDDFGKPKPAHQKVNKTADLVPADITGHLRITLRGLSQRELGMILQTCQVPWRLGGGKPLGLGACRVEVSRLLDETGRPVALPDDWQQQVSDLRDGTGYWIRSQKPVPRMRYPRAVDRNRNKFNRGGHVWFNRHGSPRKATRSGESEPTGLESKQLSPQLHRKDLPGQLLPIFDVNNPGADALYGYDLLAQTAEAARQRNRIEKVEPFDPDRHATGEERSGGNQSQSRATRQDQRQRDRSRGGTPAGEQQDAAPRPTVDGKLSKHAFVDTVMCEDPKGKGRACARHEPTGRTGVVQNGHEMPEDLRQIGRTARLQVAVWDGFKQLQFRWVDPDKPEPRKKKKKK